MPAPEPTWAQKAQDCKEQLDGCRDQLSRYKGIEQELADATEKLTALRESRNQGVGQLSKQVDYWQREAQVAQQRAADFQNRALRLEKAVQELKPKADMLPVVEEQAAIAQERARAADQKAQEARAQLAGAQQRLQQFQTAYEALRGAEAAADQWQQKAIRLERENNELRQHMSDLPRLQQDVHHLNDKLARCGEHVGRTEARLAEVMPAARTLPTVKSDLAQANTELDRLRRENRVLAQQRDEARRDATINREKLEYLRRSFG